MKLVYSLLVLALIFLVSVKASSGVPKFFCDPEKESFNERHAALKAFENNDYLERMWRNDVAVIVQAPIGPNGELQWLEVAQLRFWMNTTYNEEGCFWDERQLWERVNPLTGEIVEIGCQRIDLFLNGPSQGVDFLTNDGDGKGFEERASIYDIVWYENKYLQESVSVFGSELVEYALGDSIITGGWYKDGKVIFQNSIISYVPGESRTYTYSTIERAVPGDDTTAYKILADITSVNVVPPQYILDASEFLNNAIEDPNFVGRVNPNTGFEEIVYEFPQSQRSTNNCLFSKCNMHGLSLSKHVEEYKNNKSSE